MAAHFAFFHLVGQMGPEPPMAEPQTVSVSLFESSGFDALMAAPAPDHPDTHPEPPPLAESPVLEPAAAPTADPISPQGEVSFTALPIPVGSPAPPQIPVAEPSSLQGGAVCRIAEDVQVALQDDDAVHRAIKRLPADLQSVSRAVKVWDEDWMVTRVADQEALAAVRDAVSAVLEAAPQACLDETLLGPRLIMVADETNTATLLAFGSGAWRWKGVQEDLLEPQPRGFFARIFGARRGG